LNLDIDYTAKVLKNTGVPIALLVLDGDGEVTYDSSGERKVETFNLRLTAGSMMGIEEEFGGYRVEVTEPEIRNKQVLETDPVSKETRLVQKRVATGNMVTTPKVFYGAEALEEMGKREPFRATVKALSIALGMKADEVASRLITEEMEMYFVALTGAIHLAQGVDPFQIQRLLETSAEAVGAARQANDAGIEILTIQNQEVVETVKKTLEGASGSLGMSGSPSGPESSEEPTTSSSN
jgi:hypothetical protein